MVVGVEELGPREAGAKFIVHVCDLESVEDAETLEDGCADCDLARVLASPMLMKPDIGQEQPHRAHAVAGVRRRRNRDDRSRECQCKHT